MTQISMFDTVAPRELVGHIPVRGDAVAGYVDGNSFIDAALLFQLFPEAYHLSIGRRFGRCIDLEPGFALLADIPGFKHTGDTTQGPLVGYASASNMRGLQDEWVAAEIGGEDGLYWTAHYTFRPHVCGPSTCGLSFRFPIIATQWTDRAIPGIDVDRTLVLDAERFWPRQAHSTLDPHNFNHFPTANERAPGLHGGPWPSPYGQLDERQVVLHYYGAYPHPGEYHAWLATLRQELAYLAHRVAHVALTVNPLPDGRPSWGTDFRGERYQRLLHMSLGGAPQ